MCYNCSMTKDIDTETPTLDLTDGDIQAQLVRDTATLAEKDPESEFGLAMFDMFKGTNEPHEAVVKKAGRRNDTWALRAKRVKRLAQLSMELTPFQERFVHHYVKKDWDSYSELAMRAGSKATKPEYLRNVAHQTLKNERVIESIGLLTVAKLEAEGVDRYEVIHMIRDTYACAIADGKYKEANDASEMLGVSIGMFPAKGSAAASKMTKVEFNQLQELNKVSGGNKHMDIPPANFDETKESLKEQLEIARRKIN